MRTTVVLLVAILALGGWISEALARPHVASLAPESATLIPNDTSGQTKVALRFDLSTLPTGRARVFMRALLEWTVAGLSAESECRIFAYPITQTWSTASVSRGEETLATAEADAACWAVEPLDYARHGAFVRLNLLNLVEGWADQETANHGILITFSDINRNQLATVLNTARLNIRLGVDR